MALSAARSPASGTSARGFIDASVAEAAFDGIEVVGKLALHPFQVSESRTVGKLVEHPCGDQVRNILVLGQCDFFASRAHGDLRLVGEQRVKSGLRTGDASVNSWQLSVGSWQLSVVSWQLAVRDKGSPCRECSRELRVPRRAAGTGAWPPPRRRCPLVFGKQNEMGKLSKINTRLNLRPVQLQCGTTLRVVDGHFGTTLREREWRRGASHHNSCQQRLQNQ